MRKIHPSEDSPVIPNDLRTSPIIMDKIPNTTHAPGTPKTIRLIIVWKFHSAGGIIITC
jgi:hypothetical protein